MVTLTTSRANNLDTNCKERNLVKQPVITERFRISGAIDVSIGEAGALLAALTKMGFQNIGHELVTDVHTYKRNGKRA